ncbi:MAG: choice-of-anchor D domain-containing protein, partial [Myxococcales bacterium]|nr:choice-of-anchor D domain-containing protein [Myxococcales bacterium]
MNRYLSILCIVGALVACDESEPLSPADAAMGDAASPDVGPDTGPDPDAAPDAALAGRLVVEAAAVEFGLVAVGGEAQAELVIRNAGEAEVEITAFDGLVAPFSTRRSLPLTVPAGAERTVVLVFEPEAEGVAEAMVTVVSDGAGAAPTVTLRGEAGRPTGEVAQATIEFGTVAPGEPTSGFIEVQNTGALPLTVSAVEGVEAPFTIPQGQVPATASEGGSARVLVQFAPAADGRWETPVTVRTDAGDFAVTLSGRAVTPGALVVTGVEPAWAPVDSPVAVVVHGGPFAAAPDTITVGGVALAEVALIDAWRVGGTLAADAGEAPTLGPVDVRVELGGDFGVLPGALIRTPPVADGQTLAAPGDGPIGPAGNPWRLGFDAVAAGEALVIGAGAVVLLDGDLTVDGSLTVGA